ncbi:MAG: DUF3299 domain-containing protein [Rhizobiaceae bacterium]
MFNKCVLGMLTALLLVLIPHQGQAIEEIGWRDLVIPVGPLADPYEGLKYQQQADLDSLLRIDYRRQRSNLLPDEIDDNYNEIHARMIKDGLNPDELIAKYKAYRARIDEVNSSMREDLDGTDVRIPGYVLPLEYDGDRVTEFLLVPYVGACIHTPPPPANQIIHVKPKASFAVNGLFTPVWVSGKLSIELTQQSVGLSDGVGGFEVGYQLDAVSVEKYAQ